MAGGMTDPLELFLVCPPGLEPFLGEEARELGLGAVAEAAGGVLCRGDWRAVWRANLELRGATRVLVRLGTFRAASLGALDAAARGFDWCQLAPREPVRLDITCRKSRIAHAGAASQRLERVLRALHIPVTPSAEITLKLRIERDVCAVSVDSSGQALHLRGYKANVGKAPLRETLAALFLRACGYRPGEPVLDPMCGSGTFVIEAAEMAAGLAPGRNRHFAFERLPSFSRAQYDALPRLGRRSESGALIGSDRNAGAVEAARKNAARAGVGEITAFHQRSVSALEAPPGRPGLVMVNPPYGARIGKRSDLFALYSALGETLRAPAFEGWRLGMVTADDALAKATKLKLAAGPHVPFGGLKVRLYQAEL